MGQFKGTVNFVTAFEEHSIRTMRAVEDLSQIMKRLDIGDMPDLVRFAIRSGLVSPDK